MLKKIIIMVFVMLAFCSFLYSSEASLLDLDAQDISDGFHKIKESKLINSLENILDEAWGEVKIFVKNGLDDIAGYEIVDPSVEQDGYIPVQDPVVAHSFAEERPYFSDISDDVNKSAIMVLAKYGIVGTQSPKFYPKNFVRRHECVKILVNAYEKKFGKQLPIITGTNLQHVPEYYAFADKVGLLNGILQKNNFEKPLSHTDYLVILQNLIRIYPEFVIKDIDFQDTLTRSDFSALIVAMFDLEGNGTSYYQDMHVDILARHNMYPFSKVMVGKVDRIHFAQFLAQVYAVKHQDTLSMKGKSYYVDINYAQSPYMYYLQANGLLAYLTETKRSHYYFYPKKIMTYHEASYILSNAFPSVGLTVSDNDEQALTYDDLVALFTKIVVVSSEKKSDSHKKKLSFWGEFVGLLDR